MKLLGIGRNRTLRGQHSSARRAAGSSATKTISCSSRKNVGGRGLRRLRPLAVMRAQAGRQPSAEKYVALISDRSERVVRIRKIRLAVIHAKLNAIGGIRGQFRAVKFQIKCHVIGGIAIAVILADSGIRQRNERKIYIPRTVAEDLSQVLKLLR